MKHYFILLWLTLSCAAFASEPEYNHVFFDNSQMEGRYFYSQADYRTPSYIQHEQHRLPVSSEQCFTAKNALKLTYISANGGNWKASILYPDWRGKDFIKSSQYLDFRLLTTTEGTTPNELPSISIGVPDVKKDSSIVGIPIEKKDTLYSNAINIGKYISKIQSGTWIHVRIPLSDFKNIQYSHSMDIKVVTLSQSSNDGKQHVIFLDQIELTQENQPQVKLNTPAQFKTKAYERHVDVTWDKKSVEGCRYVKIYRADNNNDFKAVGIQDPARGRFTDYTGEVGKTYKYKIVSLDYNYKESAASNELTATTYPMTDEQLLDMVQEASFRYYWEGAEPNSGLALENIPGRQNMIAAGASGFGIMATVVATERGFITREQSVERFTRIVNFLKKADRFHGAYSHFMDGPTGKTVAFFGPKDNGADLVETAFMFQGLLAARQYFNKDTKDEKAIRDGITALWNGIEWDWFKQTKDSKYIYWHWSPDQGWVINHKLIGWNETMIVYLLAMASPTHGVDKSMYYSGWASQEEYAKEYRSSWGQTHDGENYSNGNTYFGIKLDVGVSNGGPLFFTHYSYMGFNPHGIKDKYTEIDYFNTFRNMALINHHYCVENPNKRQGYGPDCWGLTASDDPWDYRAAEPVTYQESGTIAPTGALASFPYTPENSMPAFKNYYRNYGQYIWGEYGFIDAFNLGENWCANIYMGLNQGPVTVMVENYRTGLIWNLFMSNPEIKKMVNNTFEK